MKQQPDSLFRDKLEHLSMNAPEAAWSRIEGNLNSKKRIGWTLKIAAALVPLAIAAYVLWPVETPIQNLTVTQPEQSNPQMAENTTPKTDVPEIHAPVNRSKQEKQKSNNAASTITPLQPSPIADETIAIEETSVTLSASTPALAESAQPFINETIQEEAELNTTVILTSAEVNQKYLIKPEVFDATSTPENTSSFQKLLEKVSDLKHQQGLGTLRQAKNEILALNFKNKKRERNN